MIPSGLPGKGVLGLTGRIGCSGIQMDSKPADSACFASVATSIDCAVGKMKIPVFTAPPFIPFQALVQSRHEERVAGPMFTRSRNAPLPQDFLCDRFQFR